MKLAELAQSIGARVLAAGSAGELKVARVCAADRMSDLLSESADHTLLVTNIANKSLARLMELMDVPGICLLNNVEPDPEVVEAAKACGAVLMVSADGMFETCGRLYQALHPRERGRTGA